MDPRKGCEPCSRSKISIDQLKHQGDTSHTSMDHSIGELRVRRKCSFARHVAKILQLILPLVAYFICVMAATATEKKEAILGFHAENSEFSLANRTCQETNNSIFSKLVIVLNRETRREDLDPRLRGCIPGMFESHTRKLADGKRQFFIDMPAGTHFERESLSAIFAHELIHVLQYATHGSYSKVKEHYNNDILAVELAADFGAGYLLSQTDMANVYEMNPELSGRYTYLLPNTHGTPSERTEAFRSGLYFTRRVSSAFGLERAKRYYLEFLRSDAQ